MARRAPPTTGMEVLRAAEACFTEQGLEATKVEDITVRAGIAKGAFYTYFATKDDCWKQIVDAFLVRLADAVDMRHQPDPGTPLLERMADWLAHEVNVFEFCWENRGLLRMLMNGSGGVTYSYLLDEFAQRAAKNGEAVIRELVLAGIYRDDIDIAVVSSLMGGAYDRLVRELLKETKRPDVEARCRQAQRLFTGGLFTEKARKLLDRRVTKAAPNAPNEDPSPVLNAAKVARHVPEGPRIKGAKARSRRR